MDYVYSGHITSHHNDILGMYKYWIIKKYDRFHLNFELYLITEYGNLDEKLTDINQNLFGFSIISSIGSVAILKPNNMIYRKIVVEKNNSDKTIIFGIAQDMVFEASIVLRRIYHKEEIKNGNM